MSPPAFLSGTAFDNLLGLKTIECLAAASDEKFLLFDLQSLDERFDDGFFDSFDLRILH